MKAIRLMFVSAVVAGTLGPACAGTTCKWTGLGGDTLWSTAGNWDPAVPGNSDVAVFDPGAGKTFTVTFADHTTSGAGLRFLSGTTTFASGRYFYFGGTVNNTNELYVAQDAVAVISNVFHGVNNMYFAKTGAGKVTFTASFQKERYDKQTEIREGTLQISSDYDHPAIIGSTNIVVRKDAKFVVYGKSSFQSTAGSSLGYPAQGAACLTVDAGGIVKFYGYNENTSTLSSMFGEGTVEMNTVSGTKPMYLTLTAKMGPSRFSGLFTTASGAGGGAIKFSNDYSVPESQFGFVVAGANTLVGLKRLDAKEAVRFASGIGRFNAGLVRVDKNGTLTLEDEDGKAIELSASVSLLENAKVTGAGKLVATFVSVNAANGVVDCAETVVPTLSYDTGAASLNVAGGTVRKAGLTKLSGCESAAHPAGLSLGGSNLSTGELTVQDGAEVTIAGVDNKGVKSLTVNEATLRLAGAYYAEGGATAADPDQLKLNGGRIVVNMTGSHPAFIENGEAVTFGVGARGGVLESDGVYDDFQYKDVSLYHPVESLVDEGTDGGLTLGGCATWFLYKPFKFTGSSRICGTLALIKSASELNATPAFFGAGDVELDSCSVGYHKEAFPDAGSTYTLRLATAADKKVTVNGAPTLLLQGRAGSEVRYSSNVPQNVEIGELSYKPGALLVLSDYSVKIGEADGPSAKVLRNAPSVSATSGRVLAPVVLSSGKAIRLLSYDATKGFCQLTGTVSTFEGSKGKVVQIADNTDKTLSADTVYAVDGVVMGNWGDVLFGAGATLAVGDGVNPAMIALVGNGSLSASGANTGVDFGEAPGYLVIGASADVSAMAYLSVPIRTAKTMTFASCADHVGRTRKLEVTAANAYAGDTYVNNIILCAKNTGCFSTGTVHVAGGQFAGGNIAFVKSGIWSNDFELSGWGMFLSQYGDNNQRGAFSFQAADVVVSGNVELKEDVRFSSTADSKGTLTGVVSGDKLRVISSLGAIVLANANTYTGGTEVISSTLTLKKGMSAGAGKVFLANGILRFENDEPITFANEVTGVGTVVLAGAPVMFTGRAFDALPFKTLTAGSTIDIADATKNALVPYFSADTDLGGKAYAVAGVAGTGRISNGTLTVSGVISPAGAGVCGTLEFADGVLVSNGATYVCDVTPAGEDKLIVNGDFDLSGLNFRMVAPERLGSFRRTVMTTSSSFTGAFAAVETPRRSYVVNCDESEVTVGSAGLAIIVR